jgi:SWI/SNF-related matrix-associated actin-dependent regulator of chromatin subfamily A member 5
MRAYQLEGLNWMVRLYHSGVSGILADEMGSQDGILTGRTGAHDVQYNSLLRCVFVCCSLSHRLGKTLQAISLFAYLREFQKVNGPHLVLVPLSTLGNWHREFTRWCPAIRCFRFHGTREERAEMVANGQLKPENYDVLLTSYEMSIREKTHISKVKWNFICQINIVPVQECACTLALTEMMPFFSLQVWTRRID